MAGGSGRGEARSEGNDRRATCHDILDFSDGTRVLRVIGSGTFRHGSDDAEQGRFSRWSRESAVRPPATAGRFQAHTDSHSARTITLLESL